ncbi:DNA-binding response regulator [Bacillus sp. AFS073361]|uniref:response regulator transcription factor n=1 Tax=Bacillus sp. AFS073361 TaxID=2033511 RepID=UPI000BF5009F|nr:response regulator transcription factor [Bacillus sp. AFS073361]PFP25938.1 DNA-binding response regulator [Bacillus sp. AFS073361]
MKTHILVIEDETQIARVLKMELEFECYQVTVEHNGKSGLETALNSDVDLILLDVMLPGVSGIEVLRRYRKDNKKTPVILLTARNTTFDKVAGLDHGANDYVTKPYEIEELLARIRACLRDFDKEESIVEQPLLTVEDLVINTDTREVTRNGQMIPFTPKEYDLLVYLVVNKNKVVTRDSIIMSVWGYEYEGEMNVIDVFIRQIRKKMDEGFSFQLINTVRGIGYTIKEKIDEDHDKN